MKKILTVLAFLLIAQQNFAQKVNDKPTVNNPATGDEDKVFNKVEVEAEFSSGNQGWREYLMKNLKANVPIKKKAPAGTYTVVIRFIVNTDGRIRSIEPETSFGYGMEEEVMRIIKKGPNWIPAMQNGRPVNAYRRQPVTFIVEEK